jgi:hypothetical protein
MHETTTIYARLLQRDEALAKTSRRDAEAQRLAKEDPFV